MFILRVSASCRAAVICAVACSFFLPASLCALGQQTYVSATSVPGSFPVVHDKTVAVVYVDPSDYPGVARAADNLRGDIARVTGLTPPRALGARETIIAGTIGKNAIIDRLIRERRVDVSGIQGKWESGDR